MKALKKFLCLIIALAMMCLVGCNNRTDKPNGDISTDTSDGQSDSDLKAVFKEKKTDLNGKTIKLATLWPGEYQADEAAGEARQQIVNAFKNVENDYNCKIEIVPLNIATYIGDFQTAVASGKRIGDILELQTTDLAFYVSNQLEDLSKYDSILGLKANSWDPAVSALSTFAGVQYGINWNDVEKFQPIGKTLFFNKTLADKYQLGDLYKMVKDKKWDWDAFRDMCEKIKKESNNTILPASGIGQGYLHTALMYSNGGNMVPRDPSTGKFTYSGGNENVISALKTAREFIKDGLYDADNPNWETDNVAPFTNGKTLFFFGDYWISRYQFVPNMEDDFGILPVPMGPESDEYVQPISGASRMFCLHANNPDVEKVASVLVALAKNTALTNWEDKELLNSLRDEESLEMIDMLRKNQVYDYNGFFPGINQPFTEAANNVISGEQTPMEALDKIQLQCDREITDWYIVREPEKK